MLSILSSSPFHHFILSSLALFFRSYLDAVGQMIDKLRVRTSSLDPYQDIQLLIESNRTDQEAPQWVRADYERKLQQELQDKKAEAETLGGGSSAAMGLSPSRKSVVCFGLHFGRAFSCLLFAAL